MNVGRRRPSSSELTHYCALANHLLQVAELDAGADADELASTRRAYAIGMSILSILAAAAVALLFSELHQIARRVAGALQTSSNEDFH